MKEKDGGKVHTWTWDWNEEIFKILTTLMRTFLLSENRSTGILRNSINRQDTYGLISKLNYVVNRVELQFGLDWRTRY